VGIAVSFVSAWLDATDAWTARRGTRRIRLFSHPEYPPTARPAQAVLGARVRKCSPRLEPSRTVSGAELVPALTLRSSEIDFE